MIKWKRIISVWNFMGAFYCFLEWKVIKNAHEKFPNRIYSFSFYHGFINSSHVSEWNRFCAFYFLSASQIFFSLKYGSWKKNSFWCRCSTFLSPTFVEIKNSFTRTLLTFNSKNFGIICYRKNTDENEPIECFIPLQLFFL